MGIIARLRSDRGASVVEYALIVVLVAGIVLAVTVLGKRVAGNFSTMSDCYDGVGASSSSSGGSSSSNGGWGNNGGGNGGNWGNHGGNGRDD